MAKWYCILSLLANIYDFAYAIFFNLGLQGRSSQSALKKKHNRVFIVTDWKYPMVVVLRSLSMNVQPCLWCHCEKKPRVSINSAARSVSSTWALDGRPNEDWCFAWETNAATIGVRVPVMLGWGRGCRGTKEPASHPLIPALSRGTVAPVNTHLGIKQGFLLILYGNASCNSSPLKPAINNLCGTISCAFTQMAARHPKGVKY